MIIASVQKLSQVYLLCVSRLQDLEELWEVPSRGRFEKDGMLVVHRT